MYAQDMHIHAHNVIFPKRDKLETKLWEMLSRYQSIGLFFLIFC